MTVSPARTRSQPDWAALAASYREAATADALASYRRRRWNFADQPQGWLTQEQLPSLTEPQALALYRAAGGRQTAQFRANPIAEVRDAADFLLYDTIKLESRFDECASPEGGFGLNGAGREWPSYLLTLHEPALFAPWSPHTERGLRRLGMFPAALKRGRNCSELRGSADYSAYCGGAAKHEFPKQTVAVPSNVNSYTRPRWVVLP